MRIILLLIVVVSTTASSAAVPAGETCHQANRSQSSRCPKCNEACYPTVSVGKEKKHSWEVDTKTICIPKVRFPWEKGCSDNGYSKPQCPQPKCGRTICVNMLLKRTYECETCKYHWDSKSTKKGNRGCNGQKVSQLPKNGPPVPAPMAVDAAARLGDAYPLTQAELNQVPVMMAHLPKTGSIVRTSAITDVAPKAKAPWSLFSK